MKKTYTKTETIRTVRRKIASTLKRYKVKQAALFGSAVTGVFRSTSDIDLLIEFEKKSQPGIFEFIRLKRELEKKMNRSVDLVTYNALHPFLRKKILDQKQVIYGKNI